MRHLARVLIGAVSGLDSLGMYRTHPLLLTKAP